ncbi:MAG: DUF2946 family protein [Rhodospirillaceae bacterium]|nr:DUF2946 family protein [Rhodospirillaceae bacterium]
MHTVRTRFSRLSAAIMLVALVVNIIAPLAGTANAYAAAQDQSGPDGVLYVCTQAGFVAIADTADNAPIPKKLNGEHCDLCVLGGGTLLAPATPTFISLAPVEQKQNRPTTSSETMVSKNNRGINPSRAPPFIV